MSRWKLFGRSKLKEEITDVEMDQELEDQPLAEYHETLQTDVFTSKKGKTSAPSDQRIWRDVNSIEERIDNLHKINAQKPASEVEKTVDRLLEKKRKK